MSDTAIDAAARFIRAGQLVAFPTETVYGLGANALDAAAVDRIYVAKGRPPGSPLIVHVSSIEMARGLVREWPERAAALAQRFWPGPLTLVLPKAACVPDRLTAGLPTVGVRMPDHPVALALIRAAGVPIAAPSANRFAGLSPTRPEHVVSSLGGADIAMVLDGEATRVGIESTVLSLAGAEPVLLRPGMLSQAQLEDVIGPVQTPPAADSQPHPSPGMHPKHYSPATRLLIVDRGVLPGRGVGAYLWIRSASACEHAIQMPADPAAYARSLYATLHDMDALHLDWIAVERVPSGMAWAAIADRIERAAAG